MNGESDGNLAVLIDRDGTLIRDVGYLSRLEQVEVLPRVPQALQLLRRNGLKLAVVTNQSVIARGYLSEEDLQKIHHELRRQLAEQGAFLDGIYYCPHHPSEGIDPYRISCRCRKPDVGLARQAAADLRLNLRRSYVVGDQVGDMDLAVRIGAKAILIRDRRPETVDCETGGPVLGLQSAVYVAVTDLWEAAQWIVRDLAAR